MEDTLEADIMGPYKTSRLSLNPCFNGRYSGSSS